MDYTRLGRHTVNAVRLAEVLQVLAKHGFADILRRTGFLGNLPARVLRGLRLMKAPQGEPTTFGKRLRAALVELGPTYVKLGQVLSTRPDLVGDNIASELSSLQDHVEPLPFEGMVPVIETALGRPWIEVFDGLETTPVASGSISQVYRGSLPNGRDVAVKVQRPGIEKKIESDLRLMRQVAEWLADHSAEARFFDPVGIVAEFTRSVRRELDFVIEAQIIEQFRQNFEDEPRVLIPRVLHAYSSRHLLMMDWVDGVRVDDLSAYAARHCDPVTISELGCDILCRMVFEQHLFHADPHPGNVFITRDNQIAFLDLGMAGRVDAADAAAIADLFLSVFHQDAGEFTAAMLPLVEETEPENRFALEQELADFLAFEANSIVAGGQVARGIERASSIMRRHSLEVAPRFTLLVKALATIEMVGRQLNPRLDMVPILRPYVERMIAKRYRPGHLLWQARREAAAFLRLGRQLPGDLSALLRQLRRGRMRLTMHHEHLENLATAIDRASSRNTVGMIVAALIVGSSLLITTQGGTARLGMAGYVFAGLLGTFLVISILWGRRF